MTGNEYPGWVKAPLLPYCSSDLERDLDRALSHVETVEIPIRDLWNPWKCPIDVLPYLAWALSVDQWSSTWPEAVKRQVVSVSLDVHRIKGTRPAVEMALEALNVQCDIYEWFELPDGELERGTFRIMAWVNDNLGQGADMLSRETYQQIKEAVDIARPASRPFIMTVGAKLTPKMLGFGAAMTGCASLLQAGGVAVGPTSLDSIGVVGVGGVTSGAILVRFTMEATL